MTLLSSVPASEATPIDLYLAAQADLTAVERFAQRHAADLLPRQERYYRDLIPLDRPQPGQQYAFAVDLDTCTGCKACVTACHSLNGLDDGESWRRVTTVPGTRQTVTAGCHHCVDPACLKGCPVDAYEKDAVTGVVVHLDDQCIGCQYCTLTCPYDVPVYSHDRGIVRKCDLCHDRLAVGEAPACVQACPNDAITVEIVDVAAVPTGGTRPTTAYRTTRTARTAQDAVSRTSDRSTRVPFVEPAPAGATHTPLAVMLVLTQLSVGAFVADLLLRAGRSQPLDAAVAAAAGLLALAASVLHLGRPRYAYRAVIGLRHSWLSREVVAFGAFTGLAVPYALALALGHSLGWLGAAVAVCGVAGVACSVLIYATTGRPAWPAPRVTALFALTTAVAGVATTVWASAAAGTPVGHERALLLALAALVAVEVGMTRAWRSGAPVAVAAALVASAGVPLLGATVVLAAVVWHELAARVAFFR